MFHRQRDAVDEREHSADEQAVEAHAENNGASAHFISSCRSSGPSVYVVAALLLKRAANLGADVWRTTRIINYTAAAASTPLWLFGGTIPSASLWWQPALGGLLFLSGQLLTLLALNIGDVSVATPVLGVKILLVALLRLSSSATRSARGCGLPRLSAASPSRCSISIASTRTAASAPRSSWRGSAPPPMRSSTCSFRSGRPCGAPDVFCRSRWCAGRYIHWRSAHTAPELRHGERRRQPRYGWWLAGGAACFALQGLMFITPISIYGNATTANVLYSSRGLWSVVAVWAVGHWFSNREQHLGARVLVWRLLGAVTLDDCAADSASHKVMGVRPYFYDFRKNRV